MVALWRHIKAFKYSLTTLHWMHSTLEQIYKYTTIIFFTDFSSSKPAHSQFKVLRKGHAAAHDSRHHERGLAKRRDYSFEIKFRQGSLGHHGYRHRQLVDGPGKNTSVDQIHSLVQLAYLRANKR